MVRKSYSRGFGRFQLSAWRNPRFDTDMLALNASNIELYFLRIQVFIPPPPLCPIDGQSNRVICLVFLKYMFPFAPRL
jgi:hypothetical protein